MLAAPEPACLVIADISGYTGYVTGVELDHAQDILADLMDRVVGGLSPPFQLAKLEGDAAFCFRPAERLDGSLLLEAIEGTYFAFRRRQRDIAMATSCRCDACCRIPQLDLKFVVHHGEIVRHRVAGREELMGRDVIAIHRLLKNSAAERLGGHAYALYTAASLNAAAVEPKACHLVRHSETVDAVGAVEAWLGDLEVAWQQALARQRLEVTPEMASLVMTFDAPVAVPVAWEYFSQPGPRVQWSGVEALVSVTAASGRRGVGDVNHCMHGADTIVEEVLDWRPFEYATYRYTPPMEGVPAFLETDAFITRPGGGTRFEVRLAPNDPAQQAAWEAALPILDPMIRESSEGLVRMLEEVAARGAT